MLAALAAMAAAAAISEVSAEKFSLLELFALISKLVVDACVISIPLMRLVEGVFGAAFESSFALFTFP